MPVLSPLRPAALLCAAAAFAAVPVAAQAPAPEAPVPGVSMGSIDAPVVIYEFADFQCTGCRNFALTVAPQMKERLVETGLVRFVYLDFPLERHAHAFRAARAARCAEDQGRYWEYSGALYARYSALFGIDDADGVLREAAAEAALEPDAFEACLASDRHAETVARSMALAHRMDVRGTPTLFVNGRKVAPVSYLSIEALEETVREEAARVRGEADACCSVDP